MSAVEAQSPSASATADSVALIRRQLEPIQSLRSLLDSFRREALFRLAVASASPAYAAEALETAYSMRWLELGGTIPFPARGSEAELPA